MVATFAFETEAVEIKESDMKKLKIARTATLGFEVYRNMVKLLNLNAQEVVEPVSDVVEVF